MALRVSDSGGGCWFRVEREVGKKYSLNKPVRCLGQSFMGGGELKYLFLGKKNELAHTLRTSTNVGGRRWKLGRGSAESWLRKG